MKNLIVSFAIIFIISSVYSIDVWLKLSQHGQKINISIFGFVPEKPVKEQIELSKKIKDVLKYDLLFTKYFNIIEVSVTPEMSDPKKYFSVLNKQGTDILIKGTIKQKNDKYTLETEVFDTSTAQQILAKTYNFEKQNYRTVAHQLNDEIVLTFTGELGIAHTKIVFVNNSGGSKEIYTVDYDGYNLKKLTNNNSINLFPRWSPDGKKIIYTTYKDRNPDLYIMNSDGTDTRPVSTYQGLNVCAGWLPDSQSILLTLSKGGSPNIYRIDLTGKILDRITFGNNIDMSVSISNNGKEFVFISGRAGYPQMYIANIDGTNPRRVSTEGYTDSPGWSARGEKIVFSMRTKGKYSFDIYIYDISKENYYQLTNESSSNESPHFSPDERYIVFVSDRNKSHKYELFIMSVDGTSQKKILDIKGSSFSPNWSK